MMDIEEELRNTQKRINIMANVIVEISSQLSHTQPDFVVENILNAMKAWEKAEAECPMAED